MPAARCRACGRSTGIATTWSVPRWTGGKDLSRTRARVFEREKIFEKNQVFLKKPIDFYRVI
jgi:hypothetical protein